MSRTLKKCLLCSQYSLVPIVNNDILIESKRLVDLKKSGRPDVNKILLEKQIAKMRPLVETELRKSHQKCSYCQEDLLLGLMVSDNDIIKYGYKLYNEFAKFMEIEESNLPKEIIIRTERGFHTTGNCIFNEKLNKFIITLGCEEMFYKHDLKPSFQHEFTHVAQLYDVCTGKQKKEKEITYWYDEYEASGVEIATHLNFNSINDNKKIRLSSKLIFRNKTMTLKNYLDEQAEISIEKINEFAEKNMTLEVIALVCRFISYYGGKLNFCKQHLDDDSIKQLKGIDIITDCLQKHFAVDDIKLSELLKLLEKHINNTSGNIDKNIYEALMKEIHLQLICNIIPEYKHLRTIEDFTKWNNENNKKEII